MFGINTMALEIKTARNGARFATYNSPLTGKRCSSFIPNPCKTAQDVSAWLENPEMFATELAMANAGVAVKTWNGGEIRGRKCGKNIVVHTETRSVRMINDSYITIASEHYRTNAELTETIRSF